MEQTREAPTRRGADTARAEESKGPSEEPSVGQVEDTHPHGFGQSLPNIHGARVCRLAAQAMLLQARHRIRIVRLEAPLARI